MLIHAHMPAPYWVEALATATYLLNRRPSSAVRNAVPYVSRWILALGYAKMLV
jgi:hypothetical protein